MTRWLIALLLACAGAANAATITIVVVDGPNEGFNDPTPRSPEGGNTGNTLGKQRLALFQAAADVWAQKLVSNRTIKIEASFDPLECSPEEGAVLGQAGPVEVFADFPNAPFPATWYPSALAESLANAELSDDPSTPEIEAQFSSSVDQACLGPGTRFWYGTTAGVRPSGTLALFPVVLHEIGHGLGFLTLACTSSTGCGTSAPFGSLFLNSPDAWTRFMRDEETSKSWFNMTNAQRAASMTNDPDLTWTGSNVTAALSSYPNNPQALRNGKMRLHAPNPIEPGSSISHFTADATNPSYLMEPALSNTLFAEVDLTVPLFRDIGWNIVAGGGTPANTAPVLTRPPSYTVIEDTVKALSGISVSDADANSADLLVTLSVPAGAINAPLCTGVLAAGSTASRTLTGSQANLNACFAANAVTYTPVANSTTAQTLTFVANDNGNTGTGGALSDTESVPMTFIAVNDAPVLTVTTPLDATAGVAKPLVIGIADDSATSLKLTLVANAGTFNLPSCSGVTPSGTSTIRSFEGTLAQLAACANGGTITYTPNANAPATDTIQVSLDDQDNVATGGAKTAARSITVHIARPAETPIFRNGFE